AGGYWRHPELTAERFEERHGERRYRTGDLMAWTEDGRLLFLGRADEQIKLRGFRIEPGEIESALLARDGVEGAAVVARTLEAGSMGDSRLVAFVEGPPDDFPEGEEPLSGWRRQLARTLPPSLIPGHLVVLPELPRLPNGKVDRRRLRTMPLEGRRVADRRPGSDPRSADEPVASGREQAFRSLWQGLLDVEQLGLDDNFFELGGHSLLVAEMAVAIEHDTGVRLTAAHIFEHPTVRQLARLVDRRSAGQDAGGRDGGPTPRPYGQLFPLQPSGAGAPLIVAIPHFFSAMLARRFRGERPVYGLRGIGLRSEGNLGRWPDLRALALDMAGEIRRRFPDGGFHVAGYSFGASMAVETVRVMEEQGIPVHGLYLIAPMPLDILRLGPLRLQVRGLRRPLDALSRAQILHLWLRDHDPRTRRPYAYAWRWLRTKPLRHLLAWTGRLRRSLGLPLGSRILHADVRVERFRLHARYRPGPVHAPTVVFNAREPETDAAATWRPLFQGPFEVVPTPDPHLDDDSAEAARRVILERLQGIVDP
ncbi:MAG: phosphopantetheine-binding protein, partial [Holophagales bacterium]|nr:phosphopantetheine-binding protein [Holophagales bacterium]